MADYDEKGDAPATMARFQSLQVDTTVLRPLTEQNEPTSPTSQLFREYQAFRLPSFAVTNTWADVTHPLARPPRRRALSVSQVDMQVLRFGAILDELVTAQKVAHDKTEDLTLAAELGQMLAEKNAKQEEVCISLMAERDERDRIIKRLRRDVELYQNNANHLALEMKELQAQDDHSAADDFDSTLTVSDFLRLELENEKKYMYNGELSSDLQEFRRKLKRERKDYKLMKGLMDEQINNLSAERDDAISKLKAMKAQVDNSQSVLEENDKLKLELKELNERLERFHQEHMNIVNKKKTSQKDAEERYNQLFKDFKAKEKELMELKESQRQERLATEKKLSQLTKDLALTKKQLLDVTRDHDHLKLEHQKEIEKSKKRDQLMAQGNQQALEDIKQTPVVIHLPPNTVEVDELKKQVEDLQKNMIEVQYKCDARVDDMKSSLHIVEQELIRERGMRQTAEAAQQTMEEKAADLQKAVLKLSHEVETNKDMYEKEAEKMLKELKEKETLQKSVDTLEKQLQETEATREDLIEQGKGASEEFKALQAKFDQLQKEKLKLQVRLMVLSTKEKQREAELKQKQLELEEYKKRLEEWNMERSNFETKIKELEDVEAHRSARLGNITQELIRLTEENMAKSKENAYLQEELSKLKSALAELQDSKGSKNKFKEMGQKMLLHMKQMDAEMKELVAKLEDAHKELKEAFKKNRRLQRDNENLQADKEGLEAQLTKLLKICITQG